MPEIPENLPQLPSLISGLLIRLLEETDLDRNALAAVLGVPVSRLELLIDARPEPTEEEYAAIAPLLNHHFEEFAAMDLTAELLKKSKHTWDIAAGKTNGNEVSE